MNRIKELREKAGLKQSNIEYEMKLCASTISDWENEFKYPNVLQAIQLAKILETSVENLYGKED